MSSYKLGPSRKRNTFSLKAALKRRSQTSRRLQNDLKGVEKRRASLRETLGDVSGVMARTLAQLRECMPVTQEDVSGGKPIAAARASRLEKTMRKSTSALALLTEKVGQLTEAITREDAALRAAEKEMKEARARVKIFMDDTLRLVNDISREVTETRADFADDLREDKSEQLGDPYLISSLMRTRTRPRNATAVGIYPRRRGGAVRKPKAAEAPLAVKGARIAVKAVPDALT